MRRRNAAGGGKGRRGLEDEEADLDERRLTQQPALKDYGKIEKELKAELFEAVKAPQTNEKTNASIGEQAQKTADVGKQ